MVEMRVCSFCGKEIEPGTGKMYVKKDGTVFLFCTNKCSKNMIDMKRVPRRITWTRAYAREKDVRMAAIGATQAKKPEAPKVEPAPAPAPEAKPSPVEEKKAEPSAEEAKPETKAEEKPAEEKKKPARAKKVKAEKAEEKK